MEPEKYETLNKYDRMYGDARQVGIRATKQPSTVQTFIDELGRAESYIVDTFRVDDKGDYIFVQQVDDKQNVTRMAIPPKVVKLMMSHQRSLDKRTAKAKAVQRSERAKAVAKARMERGEMPAFLVKKA